MQGIEFRLCVKYNKLRLDCGGFFDLKITLLSCVTYKMGQAEGHWDNLCFIVCLFFLISKIMFKLYILN